MKPKDGKPDTAIGDFAGAFAKAPVKLDQTYTTPDQSHCDDGAACDHRCVDGDKLTLWTSNQMLDWAVRDMARRSAFPRRTSTSCRPLSAAASGRSSGSAAMR